MKRHLPYDRAARLADQIYRIVSEVCYTELSNPRLSGVQITQARMTKDLRTVRIYFHIMKADSEGIQRVKDALKSASGMFKRAIGDQLPLKFIPEMEFFYDETSDVQEHIEEIFEHLDRRG